MYKNILLEREKGVSHKKDKKNEITGKIRVKIKSPENRLPEM